MNDTSNTNRSCPFLGISDDTATVLSFPSLGNYCHRSKPIASPQLNHQKEVCLGGQYNTCPVYLNQKTGPLPTGLRAALNTSSTSKNNSRKIWTIVLMGISLVLILGWGFTNRGLPTPDIEKATQTATTPTVTTPTVISPPTVTASLSSTIKPTPTLFVSSMFPTATRKPHRIEELIGVNYIFRIYRVEQGLSLGALASVYDTTVAALLAVNYKLSTPLAPGQLIVIPINQVDVSGLPQFEVFHVTENINIEDLAALLNVDSDLLRYYNGFTTNEQQLIAKEWILIPRERAKIK